MKTKIILFFLALLCVGLTALVIKLQFFPPQSQATYDKVNRLNKLSGAQKLLLAEQYHYHEYKKSIKGLLGNAVIMIRWEAKYEYILDLDKNPLQIVRNGNNLDVTAPPIELNDPKIDLKKYSPLILQGNLFVNENKIIIEEMRELTEVSTKFGNEFLASKEINKLVHDQLKLFILQMAAQLELKVDNVNITFKKLEVKTNTTN